MEELNIEAISRAKEEFKSLKENPYTIHRLILFLSPFMMIEKSADRSTLGLIFKVVIYSMIATVPLVLYYVPQEYGSPTGIAEYEAYYLVVVLPFTLFVVFNNEDAAGEIVNAVNSAGGKVVEFKDFQKALKEDDKNKEDDKKMRIPTK